MLTVASPAFSSMQTVGLGRAIVVAVAEPAAQHEVALRRGRMPPCAVARDDRREQAAGVRRRLARPNRSRRRRDPPSRTPRRCPRFRLSSVGRQKPLHSSSAAGRFGSQSEPMGSPVGSVAVQKPVAKLQNCPSRSPHRRGTPAGTPSPCLWQTRPRSSTWPTPQSSVVGARLRRRRRYRGCCTRKSSRVPTLRCADGAAGAGEDAVVDGGPRRRSPRSPTQYASSANSRHSSSTRTASVQSPFGGPSPLGRPSGNRQMSPVSQSPSAAQALAEYRSSRAEPAVPPVAARAADASRRPFHLVAAAAGSGVPPVPPLPTPTQFARLARRRRSRPGRRRIDAEADLRGTGDRRCSTVIRAPSSPRASPPSRRPFVGSAARSGGQNPQQTRAPERKVYFS